MPSRRAAQLEGAGPPFSCSRNQRGPKTSDPIPPFEHLLYREKCKMHFSDSMGSHVGEGELVLTESQLVFLLASDPPFAPGQEAVFFASLHSLRARVTKPSLGHPKLEILHDRRLVRFSVLHPEEWLAAIEGPAPQ